MPRETKLEKRKEGMPAPVSTTTDLISQWEQDMDRMMENYWRQPPPRQ